MLFIITCIATFYNTCYNTISTYRTISKKEQIKNQNLIQITKKISFEIVNYLQTRKQRELYVIYAYTCLHIKTRLNSFNLLNLSL